AYRPSPVNWATIPPNRLTSEASRRTTSSNRNFDRSGPSFSAIAVEPAMSTRSTETIRRSPEDAAITRLSVLWLADGLELSTGLGTAHSVSVGRRKSCRRIRTRAPSSHRQARFVDHHRVESILEAIGNTPLVRMRRCAPSNGAELWLKLE